MKKKVFLILALISLGLGVLFLRQKGEEKVVFQASKELMATPAPISKATSPVPQKPTPPPTSPTPALVFIHHPVPFTSQAPFAEWDQSLFQDGCEEASVLMAISWANNQTLGDKTKVKEKLLAMFDWQEKNFGVAHDTSATDTNQRLVKEYSNYPNSEVIELNSPTQIAQTVVEGNLAIIPMDGQKLNNPNFTAPGPERHMLVVIGYDPKTLEFITNDPGTRNGQDYRYPISVFWEAIRDYPTGDHEPIGNIEKRMILIKKN